MNELFGLSNNDIELIKSVLEKEHSVQEAFIFGSRAKGNYKKGSDVDIALKGHHLNLQIVSKLSSILNEETIMPFYFDLIVYDSIKSQDLKDHIDRVGVKIYP
ncbi:MAG TPA: nucleotidyltransferase domain-containing protein [Prolixibacteraceae bacterium]|nr:nucleotidyltransferase domain-containing protein [Lentimicrobium sp.]HLN72401.1 nucleotidyltransferase domain-containing protein [Prolixibacteraceae bacterium]